MNDNVEPIVLELIETRAALEPLEKKYETAKEAIRAIGPDTYEVPGRGWVLVSAPVARKPKGSQVVVDPEKLGDADPELKAELFERGILKTDTVYTRASRSKVEVRLESS